MTVNLPSVVDAYVKAANRRDLAGFRALFGPDAVVQDEGAEHRGPAAISHWLESTASKYAFSLKPTGIAEDGHETVVTMHVTGDFPGSPVSQQFHFEIDADRIKGLRISA